MSIAMSMCSRSQRKRQCQRGQCQRGQSARTGVAMAMAIAVAMAATAVTHAQVPSQVPSFDALPGSGDDSVTSSALRALEQMQELQGMLDQYQISLPPELRFSQELRTLSQQTEVINARIQILERIGILVTTLRTEVDLVQSRIGNLPPEILVLMYQIGDISSVLNLGSKRSPVRGEQVESSSADDDTEVSAADKAGLALVDELVQVHWASNMDGGEVLPEQPVRLIASFGGQYYEIKTGDRIAGFEIGPADTRGVGVVVFRGEDTFELKF